MPQDRLIAAEFHEVMCSHEEDPKRRRLALMQARLPVGIAGNGMSAMESIRLAAVLGTWAQCRHNAVGAAAPAVPSSHAEGIALGGPVQDLPLSPREREVSLALMELMRQHAAGARRYAAVPSLVCHGHNMNGAGSDKFHPGPGGLPNAATLLPLSEFGSISQTLPQPETMALISWVCLGNMSTMPSTMSLWGASCPEVKNRQNAKALKWRPAARDRLVSGPVSGDENTSNQGGERRNGSGKVAGVLPLHARLHLRSCRHDMDPAVGTSRCRRCTTSCCSKRAARGVSGS
jgi:hypothetical protein